MNNTPFTDYGEKMTNIKDPNALSVYEAATFGAGCFWGTEHVFRQIPGIVYTQVGYMGGRVKNPDYKTVCMGNTNHAEVVQMYYDPNAISYERLLDIFFEIHDPTTLNRQGNDVGTQYRSVIFYHTPEQKTEAVKFKAELTKSKRFKRPVVTQIEPAGAFWAGEEYHQRYLEKNPGGYCHIPTWVMKDVVKKNQETDNQKTETKFRFAK